MKEFRPYQVDGLGATLRVVESGGKCALVVMATGLGKTVVAARLARTLWNIFGWRTLFVMHMVDPLKKISGDHFREEFEGTTATFGMFTGDEKSNVNNCDVLFSTFQTMLPNLSFFAPGAFQLIVVDEAHHIWAETFKQVVDYFTPEFLFGMTATPDRMDGKNIREVFGDEVYDYPLAEALAHGEWLADVDYRVVADDVDKAALAELLTRIHSNRGVRITQGEIDKAVFLAEKLDVQARLIREVQEDGNLKTIAFCRDTKHLKLMHKLLPDYLPFHSKIKKKILDERFAAFEKGTIRKLLVIDKFNESVDVPDAELIVFLRATESRTIWLQQLGRGLRRPNGKKTVTVLDFVANCDRIFNIHEFTKAVRDWKPPPTRDAQTIRTGWRVTLTQEVRDILEVLRLGDRPRWSQRFAELEAFKAKHGHCRVPSRWSENEELATWVLKTRLRKSAGTLNPELERELEALGFAWSAWGQIAEQHLASLRTFKEKHGHCRVPKAWCDKKLSNWVGSVRKQKRTATLNPELERELEALGFAWSAWGQVAEQHLESLRAFKQKHGHCRVIQRGDNPQLGAWLNKIRQSMRDGTIDPKLKSQLDEIGIDWNPPNTSVSRAKK